jgi:nucleolar protein 14
MLTLFCQRRQTLLVEMQRRNKVGGLVDRRLGEHDKTMTVEDKMMERFVQEKMRTHKKSAVFDLEEDDVVEDSLTHMGRPLTFNELVDEARDDFAEADLLSGDESDSQDPRKALKRVRSAEAGEDEEEDDQPERKRTKKEVYEEIIAKSKAHK